MLTASALSGSTTFLDDIPLDERVFPEKPDVNRNVEKKEVVVERQVGLSRVIGLSGGISFIVGSIIGSGIFISPTSILVYTQSVGSSLLVWFMCGVLATLGSLCYVELGLFIPKFGAEYAYAKEAFGPLASFLFSWCSALVLRPAGSSAICFAFSIYCLGPFYGGTPPALYLKLLTAGALVILTAVNCVSVRLATRVQIFFTLAKMIAIVMLIITGIVRLGQGYNENFRDSFKGSSTDPGMIGYAFYAGLWAYDGWNTLNCVTEEIQKPSKNLPRSIIIGISLVTVCYLLVNIAYFSVISQAEMLASEAVAVTLADKLYGKFAFVIPVFVACSTFGAANGTMFAGGRLIYAAARNGHLPKILCMIQRRRRTPLPGMVFNCTIALIMLIPESSDFDTLMGYFSFSAWLFYGVTFAALIWLRIRRPDDHRPFKVWLIVPIFMLLSACYLVIAPFSETPAECSACLAFILSGAPVYFLVCKFKKTPNCCVSAFDKCTRFLEYHLGLELPPEVEGVVPKQSGDEQEEEATKLASSDSQ